MSLCNIDEIEKIKQAFETKPPKDTYHYLACRFPYDEDFCNLLKELAPSYLAMMISLAMNNDEHFFQNAPKRLEPLVIHIYTKFTPSDKEKIFAGKTGPTKMGLHTISSYPPHKNDDTLNKGYFGAIRLLSQFHAKAFKNGGQAVCLAASDLSVGLHRHFEKFVAIKNPSIQEVEQLKSDWMSEINLYKPELEKQIEWDNLLLNLLLLIPTLGVFNIYTAYQSKGSLLIYRFWQPETVKIACQLGQIVGTLSKD